MKSELFRDFITLKTGKKSSSAGETAKPMGLAVTRIMGLP
jgi:hypothetical protein